MNPLETVRDDLKRHSMKLAAAVSVVVGLLAGNTDILLALISIIPEAPLPRLLFAGALMVLTYLGPRIARFWPQGDLDSKEGAE